VSEAVRTNLGQSRLVSVMSPVAVAAALDRMQRPRTSEVTLDLAHEIAEREGVKAIVDGTIRTLGTGYAISLRLVTADSLRELALYQETANTPQDILKAIDKLTRKLRERIGESLRDVRDSPALDQVTTSSLEALRIYAEAARSIDMGGNPLAASERLREAVRIDSTFAMAWRKLGVALNNSGLPRLQVDSALEKAYQFRDRLTERERLLAEGTYFQLGPGRDRRQACERTSRSSRWTLPKRPRRTTSRTSFRARREFVRCRVVVQEHDRRGPRDRAAVPNLIPVVFNQGKFDDAEQPSRSSRSAFPPQRSCRRRRSPFSTSATSSIPWSAA
jgi:hypothetical protein